MLPRLLLASGTLPGTALLAGCRGERVQSVLHPVSPAAERIAALWWFMFYLGTAVFVVVVALTLLAVFRRPPQGEQPTQDPEKPAASSSAGSIRFVVFGGIIVPSLILLALLIYSLTTSRALRLPESELTVQVIGHQFWWEVRYPGQNIITANEIHIPVGQPVRLELTSADVIHSFWVPRLNGKMDLMPGKTNRFWIRADRTGIYRGQCAEYCGVQHARMAFVVVALPPDEFAAWAVTRQQARPSPDTELLRRGEQVFFQAACHNCHAIRGTEANGRIGPDLTHIGSRRTIGAGTLPNNEGNLTGWVVNPQAIKPGNRMPRTFLESQDLNALRAYLLSLQ